VHTKQRGKPPQSLLVSSLCLGGAVSVVLKNVQHRTVRYPSLDDASHLVAWMKVSFLERFRGGGDRNDEIPALVVKETRNSLSHERSGIPCEIDARAIFHGADKIPRGSAVFPQIPHVLCGRWERNAGGAEGFGTCRMHRAKTSMTSSYRSGYTDRMTPQAERASAQRTSTDEALSRKEYLARARNKVEKSGCHRVDGSAEREKSCGLDLLNRAAHARTWRECGAQSGKVREEWQNDAFAFFC
jgi:hypothetical protein